MQGMSDLPLCSKIRLAEQPYNFLAKTFSEVSPEGIALLDALLTYDPKERISAEDALRHPFFSVGLGVGAKGLNYESSQN